MNPLQFETFKVLTAEELKKIYFDYDQFNERRRGFGKWSSWIWFAVAMAALSFDLILHIWFQSSGKYADLLLCVFLFGFYVLAKRAGDREGYFSGFESGYDAGIHKAFGVTESDAEFYHQSAMDMKIYDAATRQRKDP
jgi:hypothetical protein